MNKDTGKNNSFCEEFYNAICLFDKNPFQDISLEQFQEQIKIDISYWKATEMWSIYQTTYLAFNLNPFFFHSNTNGYRYFNESVLYYEDNLNSLVDRTKLNAEEEKKLNEFHEFIKKWHTLVHLLCNSFGENFGQVVGSQQHDPRHKLRDKRELIEKLHNFASHVKIKLPKTLFGPDPYKLDGRERETLSTIIAVLLEKAYGKTAKENDDLTHYLPSLKKDLEVKGYCIDEKTIRDKLIHAESFRKIDYQS